MIICIIFNLLLMHIIKILKQIFPLWMNEYKLSKLYQR